jgi:hypothetical protein
MEFSEVHPRGFLAYKAVRAYLVQGMVEKWSRKLSNLVYTEDAFHPCFSHTVIAW